MTTTPRSAVFKYEALLAKYSKSYGTQLREKGGLDTLTFLSAVLTVGSYDEPQVRTSRRPRRPALVAAANTPMQPQHYRNRTYREVEQ